MPRPVNRNASCKFAFTGPTVLSSSRKYRNARFASSTLSFDLARVVNVGWMAKVATKARCCGGGTRAETGGTEVFPEATSDVSSLSAGPSESRIRKRAKNRRAETYKASPQNKSCNAPEAHMGVV